MLLKDFLSGAGKEDKRSDKIRQEEGFGLGRGEFNLQGSRQGDCTWKKRGEGEVWQREGDSATS